MKKIICLFLTISFIFIAVAICGCDKSPKEYEFNRVVNCAIELKNMMKDPESFEVYGNCGYKEQLSEHPDENGYCVIIPYRATNSYGAYGTDVAYFYKSNYLGSRSDYSNGDYKNLSKTVKKINSNLIYVSITGFGQKSHKPAHDMNVVGLAALTCVDDGKGIAVPEVQMSALSAGTNAFAAICLALFNRQRYGGGKYIDVSLYASALNLEIAQIAAHYGCLEQKEKPFSRATHYYNIYKCKDGRFLTVGTLEPKFWVELCNLLELPELLPRQFDFEHENDLIKIIGERFATKTQKEWLEKIGDKDFCVTPVCNLNEALASDLTAKQNVLQKVQDVDFGTLYYIGYPFNVEGYEHKKSQRAERLGESNNEI